MRQYQYVDVGIEIGHYRNKDVDELTTRVKVYAIENRLSCSTCKTKGDATK